MERPQSPLVVFGPDHIDTTRAEMLVQCLSDKIKEKRFKLQKMISINEEKKKRTEMMKNEKIQLTTKLTTIEQENTVREQQLQSEQVRIKEIQFNIQMLDEHNNSIKRDSINNEQKYEQEKSALINKFERIKQQWTEIFKPQYEQSKVYQYLKQADLAYNTLVERKESLLKNEKLVYKDYFKRRQEFCNEKHLQLAIVSIAKHFIFRRDQLRKIDRMKETLFELEIKQKQLIENKNEKMKAWENVYTQPVKRDLMDICLQSNIDQALTLSFGPMQQIIWSQPMTPTTTTTSIVLTPQNEQIELVPEERTHLKPSVTFQSPISITHEESKNENHTSVSFSSIASTITIIPNTNKNSAIESHRSTVSLVQHLTTAIDDDDDELFSASRRKLPLDQLEKMTIHEYPQSTQAFVVSKTAVDSSNDMEQDIPLTQVFTTVPNSVSATHESTSVDEMLTSTSNEKPSNLPTVPSVNEIVNKSSHSPVTFQLAAPRIQTRSMISTTATGGTAAIQPQVTSNDVQQMLLTFSPDPSTINEQDQPQPMEDDPSQTPQQQQRPTFSMPSSIESTTSTEDGYTGFNYNFGFDGSTTNDVNGGGTLSSPINFGNWTNLGSPMTAGSNDQFSVFLQQTNSGDNGVDTSFSFASFNYGDLGGGGGGETAGVGAFGSFFFGNGGSPIGKEHGNDGKTN